MIARPLHHMPATLLVVAAMVALSALPRTGAAFTDTTENASNSYATAASFTLQYYLHNDPTPPTGDTSSHAILGLDATAPTVSTLHNYDNDRDSAAGLLIAKGVGLTETDPSKRQRWQAIVADGQTVSGSASLTIWAALKNFADEDAAFAAGLYDCDAAGANCTLVASGTESREEPPASFSSYTVDLGPVNHTFASNRSLVLVVAPVSSAGNDMWFAYDTTAYPSVLTIG